MSLSRLRGKQETTDNIYIFSKDKIYYLAKGRDAFGTSKYPKFIKPLTQILEKKVALSQGQKLNFRMLKKRAFVWVAPMKI